jgi:hypothetical protein
LLAEENTTTVSSLTGEALLNVLRLTLSLLVLLASFSVAAQTPPTAANGTIEGVVVRAGTGEPLVGVSARLYLLNPAPKPTLSGLLLTDSSGRFSFRNLSPGQYSVDIRKYGHFGEESWSKRFEFSADTLISRAITVEANKGPQNIIVSMIPGGSISGTVVDENRQPAAGASVRLFRRSYDESGRPSRDDYYQGIESKAEADDRGQYELFGLPPGEYFVEAQFQRSIGGPTFYPNTREEKLALPVTVRSGEETRNINFTVFMTPPTSGVTISGRIVGAVPQNSGPLQAIVLMARDEFGTTSTTYENEVRDRSGGRFEIRNVPPGQYELFPEATDSQDRLHTGHVSITVRDSNISDLLVPVQPGVMLRGRIFLNGQPAPEYWAGKNEQGDSENWEANAFELATRNVPSEFVNTFRSPRTQNAPATEFEIANVPAGTYTLRSRWGFPGDMYLEDIRLNGRSVMDGFEVGAQPPGQLDFMIRTSSIQIYGDVRDSQGKIVDHGKVILAPPDERRTDPSYYYVGDIYENGNFGIDGAIRPGTYKVFAWESVPTYAWLNPEYMSRFESLGIPVTVHEGEMKRVDLKVIPRDR